MVPYYPLCFVYSRNKDPQHKLNDFRFRVDSKISNDQKRLKYESRRNI